MPLRIVFAAIVAAAVFVPMSAEAANTHSPTVGVPHAVEPVEYVKICEAFGTGFCVLSDDKPAAAADCKKNGGKVEPQGDKTICVFPQTK